MTAVTEAALEASSEAARRDNETSIEIATGNQLLDEMAAMLVLPAPEIIRQQETQWRRGRIASQTAVI